MEMILDEDFQDLYNANAARVEEIFNEYIGDGIWNLEYNETWTDLKHNLEAEF